MGKLINVADCPKEKYIDLFEPDGTLIVRTNDVLTMDWVRLQIKNKAIKGCYAVFDGETIRIDENGRFLVKEYPKDFTGDLYMKIMEDLL